jgi:hypothetical protein
MEQIVEDRRSRDRDPARSRGICLCAEHWHSRSMQVRSDSAQRLCSEKTPRSARLSNLLTYWRLFSGGSSPLTSHERTWASMTSIAPDRQARRSSAARRARPARRARATRRPDGRRRLERVRRLVQAARPEPATASVRAPAWQTGPARRAAALPSTTGRPPRAYQAPNASSRTRAAKTRSRLASRIRGASLPARDSTRVIRCRERL